MDPRLKKIVQEVRGFQQNPPSEDDDEVVMDSSMLLQLALIKQNLLEEFTEEDLYRALDEIGVPPEDQVSWFESMGAWV